MEGEVRSLPTYRVFRDQHGIPQFEPKRGTQALKDALIYAFPTLETELQLMQAALKKFFDSERTTQFVCELPENNLQASLAKKREVPVSPVQTAKASLKNWKAPAAQRTPSRPTSRPSSRASSRGRSRASSRAPSRAETPVQNATLEPLIEFGAGGIMTTWNLSNGQELEKRKRQPYDPVKRRKVAENRGNACDKHRAAKTTCDPDECPQNKIHSKPADDNPKRSGTLRGRVSQVSLSQVKPMVPTTNTSISDTDGQNIGTATDAVPRDMPQDEHLPSLASSDVFWGAFEQDLLDLQAENSLLSFADMASNSDSGYWTDSDRVGSIPWSSCSNYPAFPESLLQGNLFPLGVESRDNTETSARKQVYSHVFNETDSSPSNPCITEAQGLILPLQDSPTLSDETPHQTCTVLLGERPTQTLLGPSAGQSEEALMCSDDPFMGSWSNEKAHHLFDDYGWVLYHVENL